MIHTATTACLPLHPDVLAVVAVTIWVPSDDLKSGDVRALALAIPSALPRLLTLDPAECDLKREGLGNSIASSAAVVVLSALPTLSSPSSSEMTMSEDCDHRCNEGGAEDLCMLPRRCGDLTALLPIKGSRLAAATDSARNDTALNSSELRRATFRLVTGSSISAALFEPNGIFPLLVADKEVVTADVVVEVEEDEEEEDDGLIAGPAGCWI